jgi:hypothetical protein
MLHSVKIDKFTNFQHILHIFLLLQTFNFLLHLSNLPIFPQTGKITDFINFY